MHKVCIFAIAVVLLFPLVSQASIFGNLEEKIRARVNLNWYSLDKEKYSTTTEKKSLRMSWNELKREAKETAGIDLAKFGHWVARILAKIFSWLAAFFAQYAD